MNYHNFVADLYHDFTSAFKSLPPKYRNIKVMEKPLAGVSFLIDHDEKTIKKSKLKSNQKYVALFQIFLDEKSIHSSERQKKVTARIHLTIDQNKDGYPVLDLRKLGPKVPIDLVSKEDYTFDPEHHSFSNKAGEISPQVMIDELFRQHVKPTKLFKGMFLRLKIRLRTFGYESVIRFARLTAGILYFVFGEKIPHDFISEWKLKNPLDRYKPGIAPADSRNDDKEISLERDTIEIFGYKASPQMIFVFCVVHLFAYVMIMAGKIEMSEIVKGIFKNNFLTIIYSIVVLYCLEKIVRPVSKRILIWILKKARKLHEAIQAMPITI